MNESRPNQYSNDKSMRESQEFNILREKPIPQKSPSEVISENSNHRPKSGEVKEASLSAFEQ